MPVLLSGDVFYQKIVDLEEQQKREEQKKKDKADIKKADAEALAR